MNIHAHFRASVSNTFAGLAALSAIAAFATVGCNNNGADGGSGSNKTGKDMTVSSTATRHIAMISPAKSSPFHVALVDGSADGAKKLGWPAIIDKAPAKEDAYADQVAMAQDVIQQRPDAISVCGINPQALDQIIKKANTAKIPIWVHNQISEVKGDVVAYVGYDERAGGKLCGEKAAELLKAKNGDYKGEVAILDGEPGAHTDDRAGGFKDAIKKYPGIRIDAEQNGKWALTVGNTTTKDWLQKYRKLDLVFGCSDQMAQGAAKAAADANHPLFSVGIDGNPDSLLEIKAGKMTATLAVHPREMGERVVQSMNHYFAKKPQDKVIKTEMTIVTKDNVAKFISQ